MKENEFPLLKITNIDWDPDHEEFEKLPKKLELKWDLKNWTIDDVLNWLILEYDWIFNSLNINQVGIWGNRVGAVAVLEEVAVANSRYVLKSSF